MSKHEKHSFFFITTPLPPPEVPHAAHRSRAARVLHRPSSSSDCPSSRSPCSCRSSPTRHLSQERASDVRFHGSPPATIPTTTTTTSAPATKPSAAAPPRGSTASLPNEDRFRHHASIPRGGLIRGSSHPLPPTPTAIRTVTVASVAAPTVANNIATHQLHGQPTAAAILNILFR